MLKKYIQMRHSRKNNERVFIGIDPGTRSIGYGVIGVKSGKIKLKEAGVWIIQKDSPKYYAKISKLLQNLINKWKPEAIGIEKILFSKNVKTAMAVAEVIGILKLVAENKNIKAYDITPSAAKLAVSGIGNAPKWQISHMVKQILVLDKAALPVHHATDAIAIALTTERYSKFLG
jgi:crossover junction endodeoxyribonuclease RuvC